MKKTFKSVWLGGVVSGLVLGSLIGWFGTSIFYYNLIVK